MTRSVSPAGGPASPQPVRAPVRTEARPALRRLRHLMGTLAVALALAMGAAAPSHAGAERHAIAIRTTENVTEGGWVWILEQAKRAGIRRIDVLVKQDEDNYASARTGRTLQSGMLLVPLPGESTAEGWENAEWLEQMLARARALGIEVWAWWPVFHDAAAAAAFPQARYTAGDGSVFVDAAVPGVRDRQIRLLRKLLDTYAFDGVSLDWIRYDSWENGTDGPLAAAFRARTGRDPDAAALDDARLRATWGRLREASLARWTRRLVSEVGAAHPDVEWGGYLLPAQFNEVSQDYGALARAGLTAIQPMLYWSLWGFSPEWAGDAVARQPFWATPQTRLVPTLDLNRPDTEHMRAVAAMGEDRIDTYLWYLDTAWTEAHFTKVRRLAARLREARAQRDPAWTARPRHPGAGPQPAPFPPDTSTWALLLLAELYDQGLLADTSDPVIPVLAFHRFVAAPPGADGDLWANSRDYVSGLFAVLKARGYTVIALSRLQARMMSGHDGDLPARPVVLTVDDGAASVARQFHPLAEDYGYPYALSLITGQPPAAPRTLDPAGQDPRMDPETLARLARSGLVTFVSHTRGLHTYLPETAGGARVVPAALARRPLPDAGRRETEAERLARIRDDLQRSRADIAALTGQRPDVLAWPYGAFDRRAEAIARAAGFTHFLLFGGSRFAAPAWTPHRIARLPVTRQDERVPLALPADPETRQSWWLALLDLARRTASAPLIEAVLLQLDDAAARHPEAVLARAALDALAGRPAQAERRLARLTPAAADSPRLRAAIDTLRVVYAPLLQG